MACGVQDISENTAPGELDPIGGGDALLKELTGTGQLKEIGKETVNGIPTRVMNADSAEGKGKIWLAESGGFPVKVVAIGPDGKEEAIIEIKQLSLAKRGVLSPFRRTAPRRRRMPRRNPART